MNSGARDDEPGGAGQSGGTAVADSDSVDLVFHALASRPRRDIIKLLATSTETDDRCCSREEACGCVIAEKLRLSPQIVSYHMKTLVASGLVTSHKRGLWVRYRLAPRALDAVISEILTWSVSAEDSVDKGGASASDYCIGTDAALLLE